MKRLFGIAGLLLCLTTRGYSQDMGYQTFDIGGEYIWAENSPAINLQAAFNAKIHHSFVLSAGYKTAYRPITGTHNNEKGKGWGGALGYRYYFSVIPKRFFLGLRAELWNMGMYRTADPTVPSVNVLIAQPNAEAGYTFLINDLFFITTYLRYGKQVTLGSPGDKFNYGNGYVTSTGISAGWRF